MLPVFSFLLAYLEIELTASIFTQLCIVHPCKLGALFCLCSQLPAASYSSYNADELKSCNIVMVHCVLMLKSFNASAKNKQCCQSCNYTLCHLFLQYEMVRYFIHVISQELFFEPHIIGRETSGPVAFCIGGDKQNRPWQ